MDAMLVLYECRQLISKLILQTNLKLINNSPQLLKYIQVLSLLIFDYLLKVLCKTQTLKLIITNLMQNLDPQIEGNPQQKAKMSTRDFIRLKKKQVKLQKDNHSQINTLYQYIETQDPVKFNSQINSRNPDLILLFLFQQNQLRASTLTNLINKPKVQQFFDAINKWSILNKAKLQQILKGKIQNNELTKIDFRTKFLNFNRELFKQICKNIEANETFCPNIKTLTMKDSLFQTLYCQYFSLQFVKLILPKHSIYTLLDQLIVPLATELQKNNQGFQTLKDLQIYKSCQEKQKIWKTANFKQSLNNPQLLLLKQLNFNFMHQLMRKRQYKEAFSLYELLQENINTQQVKHDSIDIQKIFNVFNNSEETPLDICLKKGTKQQIQKLLAFAEEKQFVLLSHNCINKILSNHKLKQEDVESFIDRFLSTKFSLKGYVQPTFQSKRPGILQKIKMSFITSFNTNDVLVAKDTNNSYPLLTYLRKYEKPKLLYVQKLMPKIFQRKNIKPKITGLIKINKGKPILALPGTEMQKEISVITYYFYPIMKHIASMKKKDDIFEYFISKSYVNFMFFSFERNDKHYYIGSHWIQQYLLYSQDLSQNNLNKDLLSRVFQSKESERKIEDFDMYVQILQSLNEPKYTQIVQKNDWMVIQFVKKLKNYIVSCSEQQLLCKKIHVRNKSLLSKQQVTFFSDLYSMINSSSSELKLLQNFLRVFRYTQATNKDKQQVEKKLARHIFKIMPVIFTDQQIIQKFPETMKTVKNTPAYLYQPERLIEIMQKVANKQDLTELFQIKKQQQMKPDNFSSLKILYYKQRTLANLKARLQFYKINGKDHQEATTQVLRFKAAQQDLEQKLVLAIQNDINFEIAKEDRYLETKPFTHKIYAFFFERVRQSNQNFIQVLIRTQDQHLNKFSQVFERSKQFQHKIIAHLKISNSTKIVNIQKNPSVSRTVNFNIFIKYKELLNINFQEHSAIFIQDIKNRISEIECIKLRKLRGYENCNCQKQQKQVNQLVIKGHKIFKDQIIKKLPNSITKVAQQGIQIFKAQNKQKKDQLIKQFNEKYPIASDYYPYLFQSIFYAHYQNKANLANCIKTFEIAQMFIHTRFDWLTVKISVSENKKQNLVDAFTKFNFINNIQSSQKKQFSVWKIMAQLFIDLTLEEYQQTVRAMKSHSLQTHLYIFNNQTNQKKLTFHICQLAQWEVLPKCRIPLKKEGVAYSLACLMIDKQFIINIKNFVKLDEKKHKINLEAFQKFNGITKISDQQKKRKTLLLVNNLIQQQQWKFIPDYFKVSKFRKIMIAQSLGILSDDIEYYEKQLKSPQQAQFVRVLQKEIKANEPTYDPVMFSDLFVISPEAAFEVYNPKQISLDLLYRCLRKHPERAKMFNQPQIGLPCACFRQLYSQKQQQQSYRNKRHHYLAVLYGRKRNFFRASIYDFDNKPWLMDLFILQNRIQKRQNQLEIFLYSTTLRQKKTLFIQRDILKQYKTFYDQNQIAQSIGLLFRNRYIKKLSDIPKQLVEAYFQKYEKIKNLPLLQPSLINDLIKSNKIGQLYTISVIKTYNFEVIGNFLSHNKLQFNRSLIEKLDGQRKGSFLDFLCKSQNQSFTVDFLKRYNILDNLPHDFEFASGVLLKSICCYHKPKVLQYLLQYCKNNKSMNLSFVFNDDCQITNKGLVMLPSLMAVENNFYQYLMLVKSQGNQVPQFKASSRFLFEYKIEDYAFIPEMQRRLNILNAFRQSLPKGGSISFYYYIFSSVFGITNNFELEANTLPKHWKNSLKNLFAYVCQGKFETQEMGIFQKLLFLILQQGKTKISEKILKGIYPKQMAIIQSVRKHLLNTLINSSVKLALDGDQMLLPLLLKYSAPVFLQHFSSQLVDINSKLSLSFMDGFYCNLLLFEANYQEIMIMYLTNNLPTNESSESQLINKKQSLYLIKEQFIIAILSISKGQGKAMNFLKTQNNWNDFSDAQILFILSEQLNMRYGGILAFDPGMWQSVYKAIQTAQQIQPTKQNNLKAVNYSNQLFQIFCVKMNELYQIQYDNLKQKWSKLINQVSQKAKGSFVYLITLMMAFKFFSDTYQFNEELKSIKIPEHQLKVIIFTQKEEQIGSEIKNNKLLIRCKLQTIQYHQKLHYICPSFKDVTKTIKHKFYLNQVQKHLLRIDNFCGQQNRLPLLKNLKFVYDFESFKNIKSFERIQKLVGFYSQDVLKLQIQKIEELSSTNRDEGIYSTSDVYGPVNLTDPTNLNIAVQAISFYQYLDLPNRQKPIQVKYLQKQLTVNQINYLIKKDFTQYITFFKEQIQGQHKFNHSFNNVIYISDHYQKQGNGKNSSVKTYFHNWSLSNIVAIISTANKFGSNLKQKFDDTMDVRLSSQSLMALMQELMKKQQKQIHIVSRINKFIYEKRHSEIIERILLMIIEDAINIMKVVRGIVIVYKLLEKPVKKQSYQIQDNCSIVSFDYQIHESLFIITVGIQLHNIRKGQLLQAQNCTELLSRKHFLDSIFSSTQFLTDYFLNKNSLNQQCLKSSTQLSKLFNLHVNVSFDYKSLYEFIGKLKQTSSIRQIDGYLNGLRSYLLMTMGNSLNLYMLSQQVCTRHQVRVFNTFNSFKTGQKIEDIQNKQQLKFGSKSQSRTGLTKVEGSINNLDKPSLIKNMFLIQIFKSQFISMVTEGMVFVLGYKGNKFPKVVKLANRNDINDINVVDLSYLLLVTSRIPTYDQLKSSIIIRVFISDLNGFIYKIDDEITKKLLNQTNQERNIADIAPMVAPHIVIHFPSEYLAKQSKLKDSKEKKVFQVTLSKQRKFKLTPQTPPMISLPNQIKTDTIATASIKCVTEFLKNSFNQNVNLIIRPPKKNLENVNISEIIKLNLSDLQYSLEAFMNPPAFNDQLQIKLSVQQGRNAIQNYYLSKRKQVFLKYFKNIRLQLQTTEIGVAFQQNTIVIRTGSLKSNQIVSGDIITSAFITQIIKKEQKHMPKQVSISGFQRTTPATTIKALDSLITAAQQIKQVQLAIKIYKALGYQKKVNISVLISLQAWEQPKFKQDQLILGMKITSSKSQFYSAFDIVSFLINKAVVPPCVQKTEYNPQTKQIQVFNSKNQSLKAVFIQKDGSVKCQEIKLQSVQGIKLVFTPKQSFLKYCLLEQDNILWNYVYQIPKRNKIVTGKQSSLIINQEICFQLNTVSQKQIQISTCPVVLTVKKNHNPQGDFSINITETQKFDRIRMIVRSRNFCEINMDIPYSCQATLSYPSFSNIYYSGESANLNVVSNGQLAIQKTKFLELHFRKKVLQPKKEAKLIDSQVHNMFVQPPQQKKIQQKTNQRKQPQDIAQKMVYMVNDQSRKYLTRAGQQRIDYIQLCDSDSNPIEGRQVHVIFQHVNKLVAYQPEHIKKGPMLGLKWKPTVRGHYQIYINGICLNPQYEMGVCANVADPKLCSIEAPKKTSVCFAEETQCTLILKDNYGNTYTQLQEAVTGDPLLLELKCSIMQQFLKAKGSPIDKYGTKKYRFSIDNPTAVEGQSITITVSLNLVDVLTFEMNIKGQALKQRKKLLQKDISAVRKGFCKQIMVPRGRFLEELFKIAEKSLHTNFSVKFTGEQGIDAGGLKRQFYDMIGRQFKSQRNQFFKATDKRKVEYFIDPQILRNKKKDEYMELLGKYLANAILNTYLIGVNFSPVFIKLLYEDPVTFDDLLTVISPEQSQRYKFLLKCGAEQFEDLQLYFTSVIDKKKGTEIQLVVDGKNKPVTKENVNEYLKLLSKALLVDRFKDIVESFRKGFNSVLDITIVRRWIRPQQFWSMTAGVKQVTAEVILNYITFQHGNQMLYGWFRRYISQANEEVLTGFLKFASGSGSIDFDQNYKVVVTFQMMGDNPKKLPISHTCWKQILIPNYKTYEIMHKLLNAAFIYCSEGFGFG